MLRRAKGIDETAIRKPAQGRTQASVRKRRDSLRFLPVIHLNRALSRIVCPGRLYVGDLFAIRRPSWCPHLRTVGRSGSNFDLICSVGAHHPLFLAPQTVISQLTPPEGDVSTIRRQRSSGCVICKAAG